MMAGTEFTFVVNDNAVLGSLDGLGKAARNTAPLMDEIGGYLESSTLLRFEEGRDPDGDLWVRSMRAIMDGGQTLVDKAHLVNSITYSADETTATVGTNMIYAGIHQHGGKTGRGHKTQMPQRAFLGISDTDEEEIYFIARDWFQDALDQGPVQ